MRKITNQQSEIIDAILAEKDVGGITAGILEKDIHVTEVLEILSGLQFSNLTLVFCGGTSLSKAHKIIERMSEDIDLKMVLDENHGLSRSAMKAKLSGVKKEIISKMESMGFARDDSGFSTRNESRYFSTAWLYQSHYAHSNSLRPHLSLEFTLRSLHYPSSKIAIPYLFNELAELKVQNFQFECISIAETLSEKVISFLRRFAQNRSGNALQEWDPALVRHIYDVYCIYKAQPEILALAKEQFPNLLNFDIEELSQHQAFIDDPRACMLDALEKAQNDVQTFDEYQIKLLPLIYGETRPSFQDAFQVFKMCSETLITTL